MTGLLWKVADQASGPFGVEKESTMAPSGDWTPAWTPD